MSGHGAITYAAYSGEGRAYGGWQVGERVGDLTDAEVRALCEWIPTRLDSARRLGKFPSDAALSQLENRLAWTAAPWGGGDGVLWYSRPAGADATGRTGNVFSEAFVVRAGAGPRRPADLPYTVSLPIPYGAMAVEAHRFDLAQLGNLDAAPPWEGNAARGIWSWLASPEQRDLLVGILDGLAAGDCVALACAADGDGPWNDAALRWITALSRLLTPAAARAFPWSTMERGRQLPRAIEHGLRLVAVPAKDADAAAAIDGVRVIDATGTPGTGAPAEPASAWSRLVLAVLDGYADGATAALEELDPAVTATALESRVASYVASDPRLRGAHRQDLLEVIGVCGAGAVAADGDALADLAAGVLDVPPDSAADALTRVARVDAAGWLTADGPLARRASRLLADADVVGALLANPGWASSVVAAPRQAMCHLVAGQLAASRDVRRQLLAGHGLHPRIAQWLRLPARAREFAGAGAGPRQAISGDDAILLGSWFLGLWRSGAWGIRHGADDGARRSGISDVMGLFGGRPHVGGGDAAAVPDPDVAVLAAECLHAACEELAGRIRREGDVPDPIAEAVLGLRDALTGNEPALERLTTGRWSMLFGDVAGTTFTPDSALAYDDPIDAEIVDEDPAAGGYGDEPYDGEPFTADDPDPGPYADAGYDGAYPDGPYAGPGEDTAAADSPDAAGTGGAATYGSGDAGAAEPTGYSRLETPGLPRRLISALAGAMPLKDLHGCIGVPTGQLPMAVACPFGGTSLRLEEALVPVLLLARNQGPEVTAAQDAALALGLLDFIESGGRGRLHPVLPWWRAEHLDDATLRAIATATRAAAEDLGIRQRPPSGGDQPAGLVELLKRYRRVGRGIRRGRAADRDHEREQER